MRNGLRAFFLIGLALSLTLAGCTTVATPTVPTPTGQEGKIGGTLHILNWQGYGSDEAWAVQLFEERYGVDIVHDYFNSEEELLTKLRTNPGAYDVVLPNTAYLPLAIDEGLVQPIDVSRLEHWNDVSARLRSLDEIEENGQIYGVPWTWGATAIAYNTEVFPNGVDSIEALWDPANADKIGWFDSYEDSVIMAAIAAGDPTPSTPQNLEAVKGKLEALMPQIRTFWQSEDEFNKLFANGEIVLGLYWSGSACRAAKAMGLPMGFSIPKEGAIGWVDTWAIPKDAPNVAAAYKWIDFMLSEEFFVRWDTEVGAPMSASDVVLAALPETSCAKTTMGDPTIVQRLHFFAPVSPETREEWNLLWQEVRAGG